MKKLLEITAGAVLILACNWFMFWALFLAPWELAL